MPKQSWKGLLLVLPAVVLLCGPGLAQVKGIAEMTCDFNIEDTTLPAGRYNLEQISSDQYVLRSPSLKVAVVFMTNPGAAVKAGSLQAPELLFNVYGDKYFLRTVKLMGDANQHDVVMHSVEKGVMAKGANKTEFRCVMEPGPPK